MPPVVVVLDTFNRSLVGSESSDTDMSNYVRAADAIRDAFSCAVIIVHHCGINDSRPRGHTSLTGAADAQLAVKRDLNGTICVTVEFMKDGEAGETIASELEPIDVGTDEDGDPIPSCVVIEANQPGNRTKRPKAHPQSGNNVGVLQRAGRPLSRRGMDRAGKRSGTRPPAAQHRLLGPAQELSLERGWCTRAINGWST